MAVLQKLDSEICLEMGDSNDPATGVNLWFQEF